MPALCMRQSLCTNWLPGVGVNTVIDRPSETYLKLDLEICWKKRNMHTKTQAITTCLCLRVYREGSVRLAGQR